VRYLTMENASLEIEVKTFDNIKEILTANIVTFKNMNFRRITIIMEKQLFSDSASYIDKYIADHFINDEVLFMVKTALNKEIQTDFDNFIIINVSEDYLNAENIYNEIDLKPDNLKIISELLGLNVNVIVNPIVDCNNIKEFNVVLGQLYEQNIDKDISLGGFLIPVALIKEHPCNAYLCDGWKCGKKISQLPKVISVKEDGKIYPHNIVNEKFLIGNIKTGSLSIILEKYKETVEYKNWKQLVEKVFINYVPNYPYQLISLNSYLEWEAIKND